MKKKMRWGRNLMVATAMVGLGFTVVAPGFSTPTAAVGQPDLPLPKEEPASIVQIEVPNEKAKDKLLELGIDLTHRIHQHDGKLEADVVVTPSEIETLKSMELR